MLRFFMTIILNLYYVPYAIHKMRYAVAHPEIYTEERKYKIARGIIKKIKDAGLIFTKVSGAENLPKDTGYIMYPNHQGKYDALGIIATHKKPCAVVVDDAKSHMIVANEFYNLTGSKRLVKGDLRQNAKLIFDMTNEVKNGRHFIIFPEGGYTNNKNRMCTFKPGCFKASLQSKTPIVPVALIDSYTVFNTFTIGPVFTQVHYLKPIPYEEYKDMKTPEIAAMVKERIAEKIYEIKKVRPYPEENHE
ncbi:MAG: 1-acyl-sn-glycerol-3-phosphate acyltransferase [Lachnospiraceae bacterium]|nr:1-acyl-sn-glycerol-3-phosphate acyltransferase [Lachnospiraceae bacterium]